MGISMSGQALRPDEHGLQHSLSTLSGDWHGPRSLSEYGKGSR